MTNIYFQVNDFLWRIGDTPDILELDHLTVSGNVTFGRKSKVILKGTVIIIANHGECINIPSGAILENKIVSGNLRILDHWVIFYTNNVLHTSFCYFNKQCIFINIFCVLQGLHVIILKFIKFKKVRVVNVVALVFQGLNIRPWKFVVRHSTKL